ncbi:MAG: ABC-F family ATP-binding cassette domain-containing protein [Corynebacterium sp.]|nr:ABC-F family ATP-binding cassette domain-containing protein [Corynebacterium sp.]
MVNLINLEKVSQSFGLTTLLDRVSLGINEGDRVGVVGLNGGGKTTLISILAGLLEPDSGRVSRKQDLRLAVVTQSVEEPAEKTVGEVVVEPLGVETFQWASNPTVREVLTGLNISELGLETRLGDLSGGQRRRVMLAAALVKPLDVLILDEPTNHIDVEGVQWLADYLLARKVALVVVTHDRWFLDTVATHTWEVHDGRVDVYEGGYNDWIFARAERTRQADAAEQRRQNLARKELAWLRHGPPARTSKPRYRIEAAEALIANVPPPRDAVALTAFAKARQGKVVIELEDATVTTPDGEVLVDHLTWRLAPGERLGLVGVNGSGKTTLLTVLAGAYPLAAGKRIEGKTTRIGWLKQELDDLDESQRVLDSVTAIKSYITVGKKEISASQLLERLGFSAKRQRTPIGDLSGGEKRRLQLTRVLMEEPNVLLLDEPTNDLDIDTLQELESLLDDWAGTLVVVSHDRYLIERIADSTWALFGDAALTNLPRGIDEYLGRRKAAPATQSATLSVPQEARAADRAHANMPAQMGAKHGVSGAQFRQISKQMAALERKIAKLDAEIGDLDERMVELAAAGTAEAVGELAELSARRGELTEGKEALELEWMELGEQLE